MNEIDRVELSKYRANRAKDMLAASRREFEAVDYLTANNRAYYCIFHMMRSVLALDGEDYKKHSAVISRFVQNYLKPERIPREYSDLIFSASLIRNHSDYDDFYICSKQDTITLIQGAERFLNEVDRFLSLRYQEFLS